MAKSTRETLRDHPTTGPSAQIDKTTRQFWEILDAETEARDTKNARLRQARLEREATTTPEPEKKTRKKRGS
ncbi:hypothetical protein [Acidimangrovimonas sediminis]|uniref:hypothetical protein n=1 Tax=Acidimangrovimonas sediminis TaxID=2056283 RepID=UPI000C805063|nr:hypothetical protein [Acidimangrovimonas sediminis]